MTGFEHFLEGGSWSSPTLAKVLSECDHSDELKEFDKSELIANDIDDFYGKFGSKDVPLVVDKKKIKKFEAAGFPWEINTVKCPSMSADGFISNHINLVATYFEVDFSKDDCLWIHVAPRFWKFPFNKAENQPIKVANLFDDSIYWATTYVWLVFKKFEIQHSN